MQGNIDQSDTADVETTSTKRLFAEKDLFFSLLDEGVEYRSTALLSILQGYESQPYIVSPYLSSIINKLLDTLYPCICQYSAFIHQSIADMISRQANPISTDNQPNLSDISKPSDDMIRLARRLSAGFKVLYALCKLHGPKTVVKFIQPKAELADPLTTLLICCNNTSLRSLLLHTVVYFDPCISLLHDNKPQRDQLHSISINTLYNDAITRYEVLSTVLYEHCGWETCYGLMLIMSIISLIPFDLSIFDGISTLLSQHTFNQYTYMISLVHTQYSPANKLSSSSSSNTSATALPLLATLPSLALFSLPLLDRLLTTAQTCLTSTSTTQSIASMTLGNLFSRRDTNKTVTPTSESSISHSNTTNISNTLSSSSVLSTSSTSTSTSTSSSSSAPPPSPPPPQSTLALSLQAWFLPSLTSEVIPLHFGTGMAAVLFNDEHATDSMVYDAAYTILRGYRPDDTIKSQYPDLIRLSLLGSSSSSLLDHRSLDNQLTSSSSSPSVWAPPSYLLTPSDGTSAQIIFESGNSKATNLITGLLRSLNTILEKMHVPEITLSALSELPSMTSTLHYQVMDQLWYALIDIPSHCLLGIVPIASTRSHTTQSSPLVSSQDDTAAVSQSQIRGPLLSFLTKQCSSEIQSECTQLLSTIPVSSIDTKASSSPQLPSWLAPSTIISRKMWVKCISRLLIPLVREVKASYMSYAFDNTIDALHRRQIASSRLDHALSLLISSLDDQSWSIRWASAKALGGAGRLLARPASLFPLPSSNNQQSMSSQHQSIAAQIRGATDQSIISLISLMIDRLLQGLSQHKSDLISGLLLAFGELLRHKVIPSTSHHLVHIIKTVMVCLWYTPSVASSGGGSSTRGAGAAADLNATSVHQSPSSFFGGAIVREAACFCVYALARGYTFKTLENAVLNSATVSSSSSSSTPVSPSPSSSSSSLHDTNQSSYLSPLSSPTSISLSHSGHKRTTVTHLLCGLYDVILLTCLTDVDKTVRCSASAALQEFVGRYYHDFTTYKYIYRDYLTIKESNAVLEHTSTKATLGAQDLLEKVLDGHTIPLPDRVDLSLSTRFVDAMLYSNDLQVIPLSQSDATLFGLISTPNTPDDTTTLPQFYATHFHTSALNMLALFDYISVSALNPLYTPSTTSPQAAMGHISTLLDNAATTKQHDSVFPRPTDAVDADITDLQLSLYKKLSVLLSSAPHMLHILYYIHYYRFLPSTNHFLRSKSLQVLVYLTSFAQGLPQQSSLFRYPTHLRITDLVKSATHTVFFPLVSLSSSLFPSSSSSLFPSSESESNTTTTLSGRVMSFPSDPHYVEIQIQLTTYLIGSIFSHITTHNNNNSIALTQDIASSTLSTFISLLPPDALFAMIPSALTHCTSVALTLPIYASPRNWLTLRTELLLLMQLLIYTVDSFYSILEPFPELINSFETNMASHLRHYLPSYATIALVLLSHPITYIQALAADVLTAIMSFHLAHPVSTDPTQGWSTAYVLTQHLIEYAYLRVKKQADLSIWGPTRPLPPGVSPPPRPAPTTEHIGHLFAHDGTYTLKEGSKIWNFPPAPGLSPLFLKAPKAVQPTTSRIPSRIPIRQRVGGGTSTPSTSLSASSSTTSGTPTLDSSYLPGVPYLISSSGLNGLLSSLPLLECEFLVDVTASSADSSLLQERNTATQQLYRTYLLNILPSAGRALQSSRLTAIDPSSPLVMPSQAPFDLQGLIRFLAQSPIPLQLTDTTSSLSPSPSTVLVDTVSILSLLSHPSILQCTLTRSLAVAALAQRITQPTILSSLSDLSSFRAMPLISDIPSSLLRIYTMSESTFSPYSSWLNAVISPNDGKTSMPAKTGPTNRAAQSQPNKSSAQTAPLPTSLSPYATIKPAVPSSSLPGQDYTSTITSHVVSLTTLLSHDLTAPSLFTLPHTHIITTSLHSLARLYIDSKMVIVMVNDSHTPNSVDNSALLSAKMTYRSLHHTLWDLCLAYAFHKHSRVSFIATQIVVYLSIEILSQVVVSPNDDDNKNNIIDIIPSDTLSKYSHISYYILHWMLATLQLTTASPYTPSLDHIMPHSPTPTPVSSPDTISNTIHHHPRISIDSSSSPSTPSPFYPFFDNLLSSFSFVFIAFQHYFQSSVTISHHTLEGLLWTKHRWVPSMQSSLGLAYSDLVLSESLSQSLSRNDVMPLYKHFSELLLSAVLIQNGTRTYTQTACFVPLAEPPQIQPVLPVDLPSLRSQTPSLWEGALTFGSGGAHSITSSDNITPPPPSVDGSTLPPPPRQDIPISAGIPYSHTHSGLPNTLSSPQHAVLSPVGRRLVSSPTSPQITTARATASGHGDDNIHDDHDKATALAYFSILYTLISTPELHHALTKALLLSTSTIHLQLLPFPGDLLLQSQFQSILAYIYTPLAVSLPDVKSLELLADPHPFVKRLDTITMQLILSALLLPERGDSILHDPMSIPLNFAQSIASEIKLVLISSLGRPPSPAIPLLNSRSMSHTVALSGSLLSIYSIVVLSQYNHTTITSHVEPTQQRPLSINLIECIDESISYIIKNLLCLDINSHAITHEHDTITSFMSQYKSSAPLPQFTFCVDMISYFITLLSVHASTQPVIFDSIHPILARYLSILMTLSIALVTEAISPTLSRSSDDDIAATSRSASGNPPSASSSLSQDKIDHIITTLFYILHSNIDPSLFSLTQPQWTTLVYTLVHCDPITHLGQGTFSAPLTPSSSSGSTLPPWMSSSAPDEPSQSHPAVDSSKNPVSIFLSLLSTMLQALNSPIKTNR